MSAGPRTIEVLPAGIDAVVEVPGSKSIANRALICAALADGASVVGGVPDGDDTTALLDGLVALGVDVEVDGRRARIEPGPRRWRTATVDARLAGTTSRFLTALAAVGGDRVTIDGHPPLRARPFRPLHDALVTLGAHVEPLDRAGHLPVIVSGPAIGGDAALRGDVSSQFVSALMLVAPAMPDGVTLRLTTPLVSRPYVDLTAEVMAGFGAAASTGDRRIEVPAGGYRATSYTVEPDASSASYPMAIAAVTGGRVTVPGLGARSPQGDIELTALLERMGCAVDLVDDAVTIAGPATLSGIEVDMSGISDLVPTVAVLAALAETPTRISGVGFIRHKESDRLGDLTTELRRAGVRCAATEDGLVVEPSRETLGGATLRTHDDHRLAMAFAVLGCVAGGIVVDDPAVVSKSWPGFWAMLEALR